MRMDYRGPIFITFTPTLYFIRQQRLPRHMGCIFAIQKISSPIDHAQRDIVKFWVTQAASDAPTAGLLVKNVLLDCSRPLRPAVLPEASKTVSITFLATPLASKPEKYLKSSSKSLYFDHVEKGRRY